MKVGQLCRRRLQHGREVKQLEGCENEGGTSTVSTVKSKRARDRVYYRVYVKFVRQKEI